MIAKREHGLFGNCQECGVAINDIDELGYLGNKDRESDVCNPMMEIEVKCAECEGSCVLDHPPKELSDGE